MAPPEISTGGALFAPLAAPLNDARWIEVRDAGVKLRYQPGPGLPHRVDAWVNYAVKYRREAKDEWCLPAQTLSRQYGDCEDIALLKRAILLRSGFTEEKIVFLLCEDIIAREIHALLLVHEDRWLCLDSRNSMTLTVDHVRDYRPILAFSGAKAWLYGKKRA